MSSNPPPIPAAEVRQARRARTRTIRRRVATGAVALFLATWALIAVELVNGHDPALASRNATTVSSDSGASTSSSRLERLRQLQRLERLEQLERLERGQQRDHEAVVSATAPPVEHRDTFPCFGSECTVIVSGDAGAVLGAKRRLLEWHDQFSRFNADSELSRLIVIRARRCRSAR